MAILSYGNIKSVCRNILSPSYGVKFEPVSRSKSAKAVKLLTYNQEVISSNVNQNTDYCEVFFGFPQSF
jgi:hypothetical protein